MKLIQGVIRYNRVAELDAVEYLNEASESIKTKKVIKNIIFLFFS